MNSNQPKPSVEDNSLNSIILQINGMTCAACSSAVERQVRKISGVKDIQINLVTGKAKLLYNKKEISLEEITHTATKLGYPTFIAKDHIADTEQAFQKEFRELTISMIFGLLLFFISMGAMFVPTLFNFYLSLSTWTQAIIQVILLLPVLYVSRNIYIKGITGIMKYSANMDTLIAISTITAIIYSIWLLFSSAPTHNNSSHEVHFYFETVAVILALIKLGKYLETKSKKRANSALSKLFSLESDTALLVDEEHRITTVETKSIQVGQKIFIRQGMRIPFDGTITEGHLALDESHLTGESLPVHKNVMDRVQAGSLNQAGSATILVERAGEDTTLAQLRRIIEEAQLSKAPIARLADRISAIFVPVVFVIALISAVTWFIASKDLTFSLTIFMSILVIACPCALGLATPTAIVIGVNRAASMGILIKNGEALENIGSTRTIVFDKTGTLTSGNIQVVEWHVEPNISKDLFLQLSISIEQYSQHPIAKSIANLSESNHLSVLPIKEFKEEAGFGLTGSTDKHHIAIGRGSLQKLKILDQTLLSQLEDVAQTGFLIIPVAIDLKYAGYFCLSDTVKESSLPLIASLKNHHIHAILLSGDHLTTTKRIAEFLNIKEFYALATPEDKKTIVSRLNKNHDVMMVGDGINDAAALASAHTALTVHNASDITIEVSDAVIMQNNMQLVLNTILLSRKTLKIIKQNLFWAFIYNIIGIPVAAGLLHLFGGPLLDPMLGALFMAFSSVSVIVNSLRLKNIAL